MVFWHVGGALLLARYVFRDPRMDLRLLILGSVLPDLVDKPIGAMLLFERYRNGRIFGHTLLFSLVLLTVVMLATRRGTWARRAFLGLPIGSLLHLLLDGMWLHPDTFWWPVLGASFPPVLEGSSWWPAVGGLLRSPLVLAQEAAGLAYLAHLWRVGGLSDPEGRRRFLRTGTVG